MKYVISALEKGTWMYGGVHFAFAYVCNTREEGNKQWSTIKDSGYFDCLIARKAETVKTHNLTFYAKDQDSAPLFATLQANEDMFRLVCQVYGDCVMEHHKIALPDIPFEKMEFDVVAELNPADHGLDDEFDRIEVVREKTLGGTFYWTGKSVRYDEMLTGHEDMYEERLHPYCSHFELVEDVVLEFRDYDT